MVIPIHQDQKFDDTANGVDDHEHDHQTYDDGDGHKYNDNDDDICHKYDHHDHQKYEDDDICHNMIFLGDRFGLFIQH